MAEFNSLCYDCKRFFQLEGILPEYLILCLNLRYYLRFRSRESGCFRLWNRSCQFQVFGELLIGLYLSFSKRRSFSFVLLLYIGSNWISLDRDRGNNVLYMQQFVKTSTCFWDLAIFHFRSCPTAQGQNLLTFLANSVFVTKFLECLPRIIKWKRKITCMLITCISLVGTFQLIFASIEK